MPSDVDILIGGSLLKTPLSATTKPSDFRFFRFKGVENMKSSLFGKSEMSDLSQEILIDTSDPAQYTVYIVVLVG